MRIKEKLEEYSRQGDTSKFRDTYSELKSFLEENIDEKEYDVKIYLQGSYKNNTNIEKQSDVDIIIELKNFFNHNINERPVVEQKKFYSKYKNSNKKLLYFNNHIKKLLDESKYSYIEKNKCIKIISGTPLNADLVICNTYLKYFQYPHAYGGIMFFDGEKSITSFPKLHSGYLRNKNLNQENFKPTVRIFKNFKLELIEKKLIEEKSISSYHIESLLYNVPSAYFNSSNVEERIGQILIYLFKNYDLCKNFKTPCKQNFLFGETEDKWSIIEAYEFLTKIIKILDD